MLIPRRTKFREQPRPHRTGMSKGGNQIAFGDYGIQALEPAYVTNRQIEAARIAMTRHIKRGGKVWINIFPDKPVTQKPAETRMGSGKGSPEYWVAVVKPGRIMFEMDGVSEELAREALALAIQLERSINRRPFMPDEAERLAMRLHEQVGDCPIAHESGNAMDDSEREWWVNLAASAWTLIDGTEETE